MSVRFINAFAVPTGGEDEFFAMWKEVNEYMVTRPGYLNHRLHRAVSPDPAYRFVNYVEWESVKHWENAHDDRFRRLVSQDAWSRFPSTPALYEIVHEGSA